MAANSVQFTAVPRIAVVTITTANTNRDGTGTIGTVLTAGSNGTRINKIRIKAVNTVTVGMIRLFIHDGSNYKLYREVEVPSLTPSSSIASFSSEILFTDSDAPILPSGYSLRASTDQAEAFNVFAEGGDY